jgi:uncharacterized protein
MTVVSPALGISFEGRPPTLLEDLASLVDVVEVRPEAFVARYTDTVDERTFASLDEHAAHLDVVYHGIGLSIATASGWNEQYLHLLDRLCELRPPRWHSEHLGFAIVDDHFLGTIPAVPATMEAADLVVKRVETIQRRYGIDFLLEHVASPFWRPDEMSLAAFLTHVARDSGCGLVLDLHNLECDEDNGKLSVADFLDELDLSLVREIHIAGGVWRDGYHIDLHARLPAPSTIACLDAVLPRCPNVDLLVFEIAGAAAEAVGREELVATMQDLRQRIGVARVAG